MPHESFRNQCTAAPNSTFLKYRKHAASLRLIAGQRSDSPQSRLLCGFQKSRAERRLEGGFRNREHRGGNRAAEKFQTG
jgi:hypothetical protein